MDGPIYALGHAKEIANVTSHVVNIVVNLKLVSDQMSITRPHPCGQFCWHPLKSKRPDVAWSSGHPPRGEVSGRLPGTGPRRAARLTCKRSF